MLKQPNFFYSQPSTLPEEALAKFYLSMTFGLSFMISSVTPTRSSSSYAYLITKIGNRNLKSPDFYDNKDVQLVCCYFTLYKLCTVWRMDGIQFDQSNH